MPSEEYKSWIEKSEDNLLWAKDNLKNGFYPLVCFLSQQAVELVLKGYLYKKEIVPPKTHNLINLVKTCSQSGLKINNEINKNLDVLTDYYFESRYPDALEIDLDDRKLAKEALKFAKEIVNAVKQQII